MRKPARPDAQIVLDYRPRGAESRFRQIRPYEWLMASLVLGGLAWATFAFVWATSPWRDLPLVLAMVGLLIGGTSWRSGLPRENRGGLGFAVTLNVVAVAMWLLSA